MKVSNSIFAIILTLTMLFSVLAVGDFAQAETNKAPFTLGAKEDTNKTQQEKQKSYVEGEAVVLLEEEGLVSSGCSLSTALDVSGSIVVEDVENFSDKRNGFSVATVSSKKLSTKEILKDLQGKKGVLKAGPNFIYRALSLTDDTYSDYQWALENKGQNGGKTGNDIKPQKLWNETTTNKDDPVIAVIDTGVDYTHPELKDKMWINPYPKKLKGTHGFDFTGENKDLEPMDNNGHGTHCAGIIAAQQDNKEGIAGISRDSKIMAIKDLDSNGEGTTEDAIAAYNYIYRAMKLGVNVVAINNSWGSYMYDEILEEIINTVGEKGAISVCASGNDSIDMDTIIPYSEYRDNWFDDWGDYSNNEKDLNVSQFSSQKTFPACFDSNYIISVGATDEKGNLADYSNYGKKTVDVTAPGSNILSTVNYDCFTPNNYSNVEERTQLYMSKNFGIKTEFDLGKGSSTVTEVKNDYFSDSLGNDSSIKWEIKNAEEGDIYTFSIPYTAKEGEQNPYFSMMARSAKVPVADINDFILFPPQYIVFDVDGDTPVNLKTLSQGFAGDYLDYSSDSWSHVYSQMPESSSGSRKLVVAICCEIEGDYTLFFDDIGISNGTKNEEEDFGKYDYYSGTSMATPAVTGAVALLKEKRSDLKPQEIIEKIKCSTMQTKSLENKCLSGGSLDLSKIDGKIPVMEDYKTDNNKPTVTGINLSGATVTVDGKTVKPASITDKKIVLNDKIRGNSTVKVETSEGYSVMTSYITAGTKYTKGNIELGGFGDDELATDGKNIYSLSATTGDLSYYPVNKSGAEQYLGFAELMECDLDKYFKDSTNQAKHRYSAYSLTYYGGYLYYIVDLSLCSVYGGDEYASESVIVKMNTKNKKCSFIKYDFDNIKKPSIAVYNNNLYLIGGYDMEKDSLSTAVRKYASSKWTTVSNLPTSRALGKCQQVGTSLVYTMGTDGTENVPQNLVYDGKVWRESTASRLNADAKKKVEFDGNSYTYYKPNVDLVSGGLLYTGMSFGNMGDTVKYNVKSDKFTTLNYYYQEDNVNNINGIVVGDKFIGTAYEPCEVESDDDWDEDWSIKTDFATNPTDDEDTVTEICSVSYTFKINTGMYNIKANTPHGKVTGAGYYVHGSKVSLTASANKGYKVKSITVNGKTYKGNKVSFTATKSLTVKVNYETLVTSVKLNKMSLKMKKGENFTLKATVNPKKADNKKLTWQSSDKKVATVTQKGKVTAKKAGKCTIKAIAKDGSRTSAKCKITVKK